MGGAGATGSAGNQFALEFRAGDGAWLGSAAAWDSLPGAVTALIDLDRAPVRVLDDGAASPVPHLVLGEHGSSLGDQGRYRVIEGGDVKTRERAARAAPLRGAAGYWLGVEEREMDSADVGRVVKRTVAVVLVIKVEADRAVKRPRLLDVAGEQHEGGQLGHRPIVAAHPWRA